MSELAGPKTDTLNDLIDLLQEANKERSKPRRRWLLRCVAKVLIDILAEDRK